jgi:hypothetical protein
MARPRKERPEASQLQGFKYFQRLTPLLARLHDAGCARDQAGNRDLFFDQYAALLLLYFFSPVLTSLRSLQQATELKKVQHVLGIPRTSLGALSAASRVFDPALLGEVLTELVRQIEPGVLSPQDQALRDLVAVDGSLLPALPRMTWALWQDAAHHAAKLHLHFEVARGLPVAASVTTGQGSEVAQLQGGLQAGRLYVIDRGYAAYALLGDIRQAGSSFIARLREDAAFAVQRENPLTAAARAAGVLRDVVITRLGTAHHKEEAGGPLRIVVVATGKVNPAGQPDVLVLATDRLDLAAELVALAYRYRWSVELFFRWLKQILGLRHLIAESAEGVTLQVYAALIACVLITAWAGRKATKRTFEMFCFYFMGWASEEEMQRHIEQLQKQPEDSS